jgi:hypothetical protein
MVLHDELLAEFQPVPVFPAFPWEGSGTVAAALAPCGGRGASPVGQALDTTPLRRLGSMAPLGLFDPLALGCVDGTPILSTLSSAVIRYGRVVTMATVGAVVQLYVKLPGFRAVACRPPDSDNHTSYVLLRRTLPFLRCHGARFVDGDSMLEPGILGGPFDMNQYNDDFFAPRSSAGCISMDLSFGHAGPLIWACRPRA